MNYEEFRDKLAEDLQEALYERGFEDVSIKFNDTTKANVSYEAMTVTPAGSNIGISLNTEAFFEEYDKGMDFSEVLSRVTEVATAALDQMPEVNVSELTDYEQMKTKLSVEVISQEANKELLENVPHKDIEDMAIIYRFVIDDSPQGMQSITVTNNLMENMGITPEMRPPVIKGMTEIIKEMMGEEMFAMFGESMQPDGHEMMYVATTPDKINGAGIIAYPEFMQQAAEQLNGDFYLLPSSRHEVILVKDDGGMNFEQLQDMVREVNATEVSAADKLTDNVYHYDSVDKVFELAADYEDRQNAKEAEADLGEKGLEQLLGTITKVKRQINPKLKIEGILLTMVDARTNDSKMISELIRNSYGSKIRVFDTEIPHSVRAAEISAEGKSIFEHDPSGKVAQGYYNLTREVLLDSEKRRQHQLGQLR